MPDLVMPRLSDSMEEATVVEWLKQVGDQVRVGEEVAMIETDKATVACEATDAGILTEILVEAGETVALGAPLARLEPQPREAAAGEAAPARGASATAGGEAAVATAGGVVGRGATAGNGATAGGTAASGATVGSAAARDDGAAAIAGPEGALAAVAVREPAVVARTASVRRRAGVRAKASPVARRIAREHGIDLLEVRGTGPDGRVVKADLRALLAGPARVSASPAVADASLAPGGLDSAGPVPAGSPFDTTGPDPAGSPFAPAGPVPAGAPLAPGDEVRPLTRLQQLVARRMVDAKTTVPDFVVRTEVDMEACVEARRQLGKEPTYNDFVIRACALALREFPAANGSYADGALVLHEHVNIGVAVAGEGTLIVPTIADADRKSLRAIAQATKALAAKARDGAITPQDLEHGTFTVSNLGMFGVTGFTAVINPPQAAILAVGSVQRRPVVHEDAIAIRHRMEISLTCDHRILYGADAARVISRIKELLEAPLLLMY